jgi:glycosyltransferase involved in cell wall biosynthesis
MLAPNAVTQMHVALVTPVYPPDNGWGGIGTYVYHLARGLAGLGHRVTILCGYRSEPAVREEEGLRVVRRIRTEGLTSHERSRQIATLLEDEISGQGIDVVEFGEYGGDGAVFQERHPAFPVVVKLHCPTRLCAAGEAPAWQAWLRRCYLPAGQRQMDQLERASIARARVVLSPSHWLLETLRGLGWPLPAPAAVVRNPFGGWTGTVAATPPDTGETPSVLVLGRLARLKGVDLLPEIFRRVWRRRPDARFDLVGQDTWRTSRESWGQWLMRRTDRARRAQLNFLGGVPYAEVPGVLARQTAALFASRWENLPYAVMECMWAGLPCVVGSGGGAHELGEHEVEVLNTARDPGAIASAILCLLEDRGLRRRLGEAAQARVSSEFAPGRIARAMEAHYRNAGAAGSLPADAAGRPRASESPSGSLQSQLSS